MTGARPPLLDPIFSSPRLCVLRAAALVHHRRRSPDARSPYAPYSPQSCSLDSTILDRWTPPPVSRPNPPSPPPLAGRAQPLRPIVAAVPARRTPPSRTVGRHLQSLARIRHLTGACRCRLRLLAIRVILLLEFDKVLEICVQELTVEPPCPSFDSSLQLPIRADGFVVQTGDPEGPAQGFIDPTDGFVVQTGDPEGPAQGFIDPSTGKSRTIPLKIIVDGDKSPMYGETLEELGLYKAQTKLHFNVFGTMAMAREEFDDNSASSQIFWLLKETELTPSNSYWMGDTVM